MCSKNKESGKIEPLNNLVPHLHNPVTGNCWFKKIKQNYYKTAGEKLDCCQEDGRLD